MCDMNYMKKCLSALLIALFVTAPVFGDTLEDDDSALPPQPVSDDSQPAGTDDSLSTSAALQNIIDTVVIVPRLDFAGTSLYDALTALARAYNLSLFIDPTVTGTITLRLDNVSLNDGLLFIIKEYDLAWEKTGSIIKIFRPTVPPPPLAPLDLVYQDGLLSVDLHGAELSRLVDTLIEITGRNIILENGTQGRITGKLKELDFDEALGVLLSANGLAVRKVDQVTYIGREAAEPGGRGQARNLYVQCDSGSVTLEAARVALADVIARISSECGISIMIQTQLQGDITATFADKPVEEALTYLLMNSVYTFKESGGVLFVGSRDSEDMYDSQLLELDHLVASTVEALIPVSLSQQLTVKVVKEHNGLLVTGPRTKIARLQDFLKEVDIPPAQVLFEVLLVDYTTSERAEFGITANNSAGVASYEQTYWPNVDLKGDGNTANSALRSLERRTGWSNLGVLDEDFFVRLEMLQKEGKAVVQSHPQVAALNGHSASIRIGTTQYYLLESETVHPSAQSTTSTQTTQRFEKVEADMSVVVTPYVSRSGELTVEISPEFNSPAADFNPDVPPTINRRVLESTVRLKNGETIILGGLIQQTESRTIDKVPILGQIPILGRLFQNRSNEEGRTELMIYITPYVYFGSEGAVDADSVMLIK